MELETLRLLSGVAGLLCGFFLGFGMVSLLHTTGKKTSLWGISVPMLPAVSKARKALALGGIFFIVMMGLLIKAINIEMWIFEFSVSTFIIPFGCMLVSAIPASIYADRWLAKALAHKTHALVLGELPILQEIDKRIQLAKTVSICSDSIGLYDDKDFCFFTAVYKDYALGDIDEEQMKLLSYYYFEKYGEAFKYKPNQHGVYINSVNVTTAPGIQNVTSQEKLVGATLTSILFIRK